MKGGKGEKEVREQGMHSDDEKKNRKKKVKQKSPSVRFSSCNTGISSIELSDFCRPIARLDHRSTDHYDGDSYTTGTSL